MGVQVRSDLQNFPFLRMGDLFDEDSQTIEQDAGRTTVLASFTVLGKKKITVPTAGVANVGNTGTGTVTAVAQLVNQPLARVGAYNLECVVAVANGGVFKLEDPDGNIVASPLVMTVGAGAVTVFNAGPFTLTITDAATDFIVGDKFSITVAANGKYVPLDPDGVDGSQLFAGIYTQEDIPAATLVAGDYTQAKVVKSGRGAVIDSSLLVFENSAALTTSINGVTVLEMMRDVGIEVVGTIDTTELENA